MTMCHANFLKIDKMTHKQEHSGGKRLSAQKLKNRHRKTFKKFIINN
jgi:hypothetical protein